MSISFLLWMLARAGVVLAIALVAVRALRRAPASLRHAILASALAAVIVLPAIAAVVPTWHAGAIGEAAEASESTPALPVAEHAPAVSTPAATASAPASAPSSISWALLAGVVWLAGCAVAGVRAGAGALRARRIAARGTPAESVDIASTWRALGGHGTLPRVVTSDELDAPIVVGSFAPVVVVPRSSATWTRERWRVVLLHELAHVRRRDGIANLVAQFACCLHWPDPLAWLAARQLRVERELAADDAVLGAGARASTYAEHLLEIASCATHAAPAAALAMAEPSRFEARVVALLDAERTRGVLGARRKLAVIATAAIVGVAAACVSPEAAPAQRAGSSSPVTSRDPALAAAAGAELEHAMTAHHASGAIAIVLDAKTGAPLAVATRGNGDARAARVPGSTMKPFTIAAALEAGVVETNARIDCEHGARMYGDKKLSDASPNGVLDLGGIMAVSSNICTAKVAEPLGDRLAEALHRYHFAAPAHIDTRSLAGASISSGEGIRASALEVAAGYTAFADAGTYHAADGTAERVMSADTARAVVAMLARVVDDPAGTGHAARIDGVRVVGKTGTAETAVAGRYYASFVGIVPADAPRFVVLVGVDGVTGSGGEVAAPVFAKIAARALAR